MASAALDRDKLSDETFDFLCTICKNKGKNREGEKYCVDCSDYYCLTCVKVHGDVPLLAGHKIVDKIQYKSASFQHLPPVPTERCDRHNHKQVDMYCQDHDDVGCSTCMAAEHRSCRDIYYIPEFIQNNATTTNPRNIQMKLASAAESLAEIIATFQHEKEQLLKRKSELDNEIKTFRKDINAELDELEQKCVAVIDENFRVLINEIEERIKLLQKHNSSVSSSKEKISSASNNISQDFVNDKKGGNAARNAEKNIEESKAGFRRRDINFTPDQTILPFLKEIATFGKITNTDISDVIKKQDNLMQLKNRMSYSIKVPTDAKDCIVYTACVLEDGNVVLCDNNKRLKRFESSTKTVTDFCDLPVYPFQVCIVRTKEIGVSLPALKQISFFSTKGKMTKTTQIQTVFSCFGLAYADGNLYVSDYDTSVYLCSISGRTLKTFNGRKWFSKIRSLAVTKDASKIYVTDWNKGLVVLDMNGELISVNGLNSKHAWCGYLTNKGDLLVATQGAVNVLQIGPGGEMVGLLTTRCEENEECRAVACSHPMSKMFIFRGGIHGCNYIEVYDLL